MELQSWCPHSGNRVGVTVPNLGGNGIRETCHFIVLPGFLKGLSPRFGATRGTRVGGTTISVCPYLGNHGVGVIQEIWDTEVQWQEGHKFGRVGESEVARNLVLRG